MLQYTAATMPQITPFFTYSAQAEQAANFYVNLFPNSRILKTTRYGENMPVPAGTVMTVEFELDGKRFIALNAGDWERPNKAISFFVDCKDQAEVDHYYNAFADGGKEIQCGWVEDKFGLCWQVVPTRFFQLINTPDAAQTGRVMHAMMKMKKMIIADLEAAAAAR